MATIPQISQEMQTILGQEADQIGWQTRFQQRKSKLGGSEFLQTLVFGSLGNKDLSYTHLQASALDAGVQISAQGLEQRFGPASVQLCEKVLDKAVQVILEADPQACPILNRFQGIYLRDSSVVSLPKELHELWPGVGGRSGQSTAIKLQVCLEYSSGKMAGPILHAGRCHDSRSPYQSEDLPAGAIRMGDLGYFSLQQFKKDQEKQIYTFSRYKTGTYLYDHNLQEIDLIPFLRKHSEDQFEIDVYLGKSVRYSCRLLAFHVPPQVAAQRKRKLLEYGRKKQVAVTPTSLALTEWTLLITDIPVALLSISEAEVLLAVRWQIELLFKLWKSLFQIDEWRSENPWRILTELYAKLIGMIILNWILLIDGWRISKSSIWKAALAVRHLAVALAIAFTHALALQTVLRHILLHLRYLCRLNTRRTQPGTNQRLFALSFSLLEH